MSQYNDGLKMAIETSRAQTSWRPGEALPLRIENVPMPAIARGNVGQRMPSKLTRVYGVNSYPLLDFKNFCAFDLLPVASRLKDLYQFSHPALHHTTSPHLKCSCASTLSWIVSSLLPCQEGSGVPFSSPCPQEAFKSFTGSDSIVAVSISPLMFHCFLFD